MNEEGVTKAVELIESTKAAAKKLDSAVKKNNSDSIAEIKKEIMDLQKQISALL